MSDPVSHGAMAEFLQKQALQLLIFTRDGVTKEDGRLFNKGFTIPAATAATAAQQFKLGGKSIDRLGDLIEPMRNCVLLAITLTTQDFTVFQVLRSVEEQRENLREGTTRTMASKHLRQLDGKSHAADLVPWIKGAAVWDWGGCAAIAFAMDRAATQLGIANKIRWGGAWDRVLADFGGTADAYMAEVEKYKTRHEGKDFIDGPHFEWVL